MVGRYNIPSSALCLSSNVVLRFFISFDISQNMIIFARFKSSSEAQLNFLRESSTLGYVRHYDLDRSCNWSLAQQLFEFKIVHFGAKTVILTEVKISHMKTGRKFSVILSVFPINPNTTFEDKQRALDGTCVCLPSSASFFVFRFWPKMAKYAYFKEPFLTHLDSFKRVQTFQTNPNILRKKQYDSSFVRALLQLQFVVKNDNYSFSTRARNISHYEYARNFWNQ